MLKKLKMFLNGKQSHVHIIKEPIPLRWHDSPNVFTDSTHQNLSFAFLFFRNWQANPTMYMEIQGSQVAKTILQNKSKERGYFPIFSNFKTYDQAAIFKTMWH